MQGKRVKFFFLIILVIFSSAGCWDSRDVEDKDITVSVLVDKTDDGYAYYVRIPSFSSAQQGGAQGSEQSNISFGLIKGEGKTIVEAREEVDRQSDQPIFLGAVQAVILTERMAYSGIEEYMLRLRQGREYRKTLDVVVTGENLEEFLNFQPENAPSIGFAIESTIKSLVDTGQTFHFSLGDILSVIASPNKCYLLHTIGLKSDIAVIGYTVFDNGSRVGFIPIEDSKGILFLKADEPKPYYSIQFSEGSAALRVRRAGKKIKPLFKDGKISFDVSLDIDAQVMSLGKNMKVSEAVRQDIGASLQKKILEDVANAIKTSQVLACDYLSFYTFFRIAYPEETKSLDWKTEYAKAEFNISVKAKIDLVSTVNYSE